MSLLAEAVQYGLLASVVISATQYVLVDNIFVVADDILRSHPVDEAIRLNVLETRRAILADHVFDDEVDEFARRGLQAQDNFLDDGVELVEKTLVFYRGKRFGVVAQTG